VGLPNNLKIPDSQIAHKITDVVTSDMAIKAFLRPAPEQGVDNWLRNVGFRFNPFTHLESSGDPHLGAYLIEHQSLINLWGNWPGLTFAAAGGGKTALRVYLAQACWSGPDIGHPFPISYVPVMNSRGGLPENLEDHSQLIIQAGTLQLLLALLYRPHWWGGLRVQTRKLVRGLLDCDLPSPLDHYLDQLVDTDGLVSFLQGYNPSIAWTQPPARERWRSVCNTLSDTPAAAIPEKSGDRLNIFLDILINELNLSSIYLLLDGVDGFFETATDPAAAIALIDPLLAEVEAWSQRRLFLKAFLPAEIAPALEISRPAPLRACRIVNIKWSTPALAHVIRQRVFVATEGAFGSLDALSTPDLTDIETQLARAVVPLPREALELTGRLLWEHIQRDFGASQLDIVDLENAVQWYKGQRPEQLNSISYKSGLPSSA